jgi:RES domain
LSAATDRPGPHPLPQQKILDDLSLPIHHLRPGYRLFRIHPTNLGAIYFNPAPTWRFNDPTGKEYGVLYAALDYYGALRETFHPEEFNVILTSSLESKRLSTLSIQRDIKLVDLTGAGLTRIGADGRLTTGSYQVSQAWSQALYRHPDQVDGIFYCSRHDPQKLCVALYEHRTQPADLVTELVTANNLSDQSFSAELKSFLDRYGFENTNDLKNPAI